MIITRALYGLKRYGAMLIGYKSSDEDDYVWMKHYFKPNGYPYYN